MRILVFFLAGCFAPSFESGHLQCAADGECPSGLVCAEGRCYRPDDVPAQSDLAPNADLAGAPDLAHHDDLAGPGPDLAGADFAGADLTTPTNDLTQLPGVPGAPANVTAMSGDASATVQWAAPSDGGSPILSYTVTATPGGATLTTALLSASFTGLTNGVAYRFSVHATNNVGDGPESPLSPPVTPMAVATAPGAPGTPAAVVSGARQVTVSWSAANNNGSAISRYTVTASSGASVVTPDGATLSATLGNLTAGMAYTFTVTASNAAGTGPASPASNPVTAADLPGAPTGVTATALAGAKASITWSGAAANGSAITRFTVTSSPDALVATGANPPLTLSGLQLGTSYTFTVTATNAIGTGAPSSPSGSIVAADVPAAPAPVTAVANLARGATVSWSAPSANFSPLTGYTVTWSGGSKSVGASTTSTQVSGLTGGVNYTFSVTASNALGAGPAALSGGVTIGDVPAAPTGVVACGGDGNLRLQWNAQSDASSYTVYYGTSPSVSKSTGTPLPTPSPQATVSPLANGDTWYAVVTATNTYGESAQSATVSGQARAGVHDALFTNNQYTNSIEIFDCYSQLPSGSSNLFPRILDATGITRPYGAPLYVDTAGNTLYFANTQANAIWVWNNASTVNGATAPNRVLAGTKTLLYNPEGLFYDAGHDRLYVSNSNNGNPLLIWGNGATATGNLAPTAQLNYGGAANSQIFVDTTTNEIYLANIYNLLVYSNASGLTGSINSPTPSRTITLADAGASQCISGVWIDYSVAGGILWLVDCQNGFYSFTSPSTRNGALATQNSITGFFGGVGSSFVANNTLFTVGNGGSSAVEAWSNAAGLNLTNGYNSVTKSVMSASYGLTGVFYVP